MKAIGNITEVTAGQDYDDTYRYYVRITTENGYTEEITLRYMPITVQDRVETLDYHGFREKADEILSDYFSYLDSCINAFLIAEGFHEDEYADEGWSIVYRR